MRTYYTRYFEFMDLSDAVPEDFLKLFEDLLLQVSGDVSKVFDFIRQHGDRYFGLNNPNKFVDTIERELSEMDLLQLNNGDYKLSPKGKRWLREQIFKDFFKRVKLNSEGEHQNRFIGKSRNFTTENRKFEQGDDFSHIDYISSTKNMIRRGSKNGLNYEDLEVKESHGGSAMATVLLVDISHSMILYGEDRITPAKKVALSLCELMKHKYPKDKLHVCVFGNDAWEIPLGKLDEISVGPFHTNTLSGIQLAKKILKKYPHIDKQILMITDGKPTCLKEPDGYYKNPMGLDPYIINKVLREAKECYRQKITISTFMLTDEPYLVEFVNDFTQMNRGRSFFVNLDNISDSVIVDFLNHRKKIKKHG